MTIEETVIVYAKRTPIGKLSGKLSRLSAPQLAAPLVKHAMASLDFGGELVDEIIMGNVLTAGVGQAPARQTAIYGGLPDSVCATTVGRVCGSGLKSVMMADQAIRLGDSSVIFAGGQESMSNAPHILPGSRAGYRFGSAQLLDSMQHDGLWDPYNDMAMGNCGEICAEAYGFSREDQDNFALESYKRSRKAVESGHFAKEVLPIDVKARKATECVELDEEPFSVDLDKLSVLRSAFKKDGTVTAGNASSINDGAALLVLMSKARAAALGIKPLAKIISQASFAHEPKMFTTAPVGCIKKLLEKTGMVPSDVDLFEINEAFSVVPMAAIRDLELPREAVNPYGGAVSLGHPIGCSGARILVTLIHALQTQGKKTGLATLCIGGGEASAVLVEAL